MLFVMNLQMHMMDFIELQYATVMCSLNSRDESGQYGITH